jgi:hypothetical protein
VIRSATAALSAAVVFGFSCAVAIAGWEDLERTRLTQAIARHSADLARERGLLQRQAEIERQFQASRTLIRRSERAKIIEALDDDSRLKLRRIELGESGRRASIEFSGSYADLIRTLVALPVRVAGLTLVHASLTASADVRDGAVARVEGTFP